jgi:hypothetical protein
MLRRLENMIGTCFAHVANAGIFVSGSSKNFDGRVFFIGILFVFNNLLGRWKATKILTKNERRGYNLFAWRGDC